MGVPKADFIGSALNLLRFLRNSPCLFSISRPGLEVATKKTGPE